MKDLQHINSQDNEIEDYEKIGINKKNYKIINEN